MSDERTQPGTREPTTLVGLTTLRFGTLPWEQFEELCLELGQRLPAVVDGSLYGARGEGQSGVDLVFSLEDGSRRFVQCKRRKRLSGADVRAAVQRFLAEELAEAHSEFVFATSQSASATAVRRAIDAAKLELEAEQIKFDVWDRHRLSAMLRGHSDLVGGFFGPDVLRAFDPEAADRRLVDEVSAAVETVLDRREGRHQESAPVPWPKHDSGSAHLVDVDVDETLEWLHRHDAAWCARIVNYLGEDLSSVSTLVTHPPAWAQSMPWYVYRAIALLAYLAERTEAAVTAFLAAEVLAPSAADRAELLARAALAADAPRQSSHEPDGLIARAVALAPQSFQVKRVLIERAPEEARARLIAELEPSNDREHRTKTQLEVDELIREGAYQAAISRLDRVLGEYPSLAWALDRRSVLAAQLGDQSAPSDLRQGAADCRVLNRIFARRGRYQAAAFVISRGVSLLTASGDLRSARELLGLATSRHQATPDGARALSVAAFNTQQPALAVVLLGPQSEWTKEDRLMAARAWVADERDDNVAAAYEAAHEFVDSLDPADRFTAAWIQVVASARLASLPWSAEALALVRAEKPVEAVVFEAERLENSGDAKAAESLLRAHSSDRRIQTLLANRYAEAEQWDRALALFQALARDRGTDIDRISYATALEAVGKQAAALREFEVLASDGVDPQIRSRALRSIWSAAPEGDFVAQRAAAERWRRAFPNDRNAMWALSASLYNLGLHQEAFEVLDHGARESAKSRQEAHLLGAIFSRTLPPLRAVDEFARVLSEGEFADEGLDLQFFSMAVRVELPEDSAAFRLLQIVYARLPSDDVLDVSDDPDEFIESLKIEMVKRGLGLGSEAFDSVVEGQMPVAFLAAAVGRPVPVVWARLGEKPSSFGNRGERDRDLQAALDAVGLPVVVDVTALAALSVLSSETSKALLRKFPASQVPWSSLHECDRAAAETRDDPVEMLTLADDEVRLVKLSPASAALERRISAQALPLATTLVVVPDVDPELPDRYGELVRGDERSAFDTVPAALSVALRNGLPLLSEDRVVRRMARSEGVSAFSVNAALELLEREASSSSRTEFLRHGWNGLGPSASELYVLASEHNFQPVGGWLGVWGDRFAWREDPGGRTRAVLEFLRLMWLVRPEKLGIWVARSIDTARDALNQPDVGRIAGALLLASFVDLRNGSRQWHRDLLDAFEEARGWLPELEPATLVPRAFVQALRPIENRESVQHRLAVGMLVEKLPFPWSARALFGYDAWAAAEDATAVS